jgi:hypothetical protein
MISIDGAEPRTANPVGQVRDIAAVIPRTWQHNDMAFKNFGVIEEKPKSD